MSTTGNKGKFSDRLKMISLFKRKKIRREQIVDINDSDDYNNIGSKIKKAILLPFLAIASSIEKSKIEEYTQKKEKSDDHNINLDDNIREKNRLKVLTIKNIDVSSIKKRHDIELKKEHNKTNNIFKETNINVSNGFIFDSKESDIKKLEKDILNLIKKKLIRNINELEIIQSELYVINEIDSSNIYLDKCHESIKELQKMISRVKDLKEKYDYLKDNFDFEYLLGLDDNILADKIIELKNMCETSQVISFVNDYKLLNEYKYLYLKIDKLQDDSNEYNEYLEKKKESLKARDIDFEKFKEKVFNKSRANEKYDFFIKQQQELMNELNDRISKIDSYEDVHYRLKGFDKLLSNGFKFFGLILLTPFRGLIPSIASQTLLTKAEIRNLRNSLKWEEDRKIIYTAIDYSSSLKNALNNLDDTCELVDSTLEDIVRLKSEFNKKFKRYANDFTEYREVISKLNKAENAILGNKIKLNVVRDKIKKQEKANEIKMSKLKVLKKSN